MNKVWMAGLLLATALFSCTDPDLIGLEVQPESDRITISSLNQDNVFTVQSIEEDSIRTDETTKNLLGAIMTDEVFGEIAASFSTQLLLIEDAVDFGENPVLDSAVLTLAYDGYYGDTTVAMSVGVYELDESIYLDSTYYSDQEIAAMNLLELIQFQPNPNSKVFSETDTVGTPQLRVLMNDLGERILAASADDLSNNENFVTFFKGLQLRVENDNASESVAYFNLKNSHSKFTIYYNDTSSFDLVMGSSSARINHFEVEHALDASLHGIQSMGGYNLNLIFNDLDTLKSLLAENPVNIATLTFTVQEGTTNDYDAHPSLSLVRVNADGQKLFLPDFFEGDAHFGGALNNGKYVFNISKYLQQLVNGDITENELYLMPVGASVTANRTLLEENVELNITYTEF